MSISLNYFFNFSNQSRAKYVVWKNGRMTTPYFVTGLNQRSLNFPLMTLLITLTLMRGHMSAQMMMAQNATAGDLMTDPPQWAKIA